MAFASSLKRDTVAKWLTYPGTTATALSALMLDEYGTDFLNWDPDTIRMQTKEAYNLDLPRLALDKLMAFRMALTTNLFYTSPAAFIQIGNALNGSEADFDGYDPLDADEAAWAVTEVTLNDPPGENEGERFSPAVAKFVGITLDNAGIITPPASLRFAIQPVSINPMEDDPIIYAGLFSLSQQRINAVTQYVRNQLVTLIAQVDQLPLEHRNDQAWRAFAQRVQKGLQPDSK